MDDPNRLSWPLSRTDWLTLFFVVAFGYCLVENRSVFITVPVLFAAVFMGISPRMTGPFGWQSGGGSSLGGSSETRLRALRRLSLASLCSWVLLLRKLLPKQDLPRIDR